MEFLILSASRYDFKDDDGKRVEGVSLTYADPKEPQDPERKGFTLLKISAPSSVWSELDDKPALYRMDFRQRPGRGGKPSLQCVGVAYVGPYEEGLKIAS